MSYPPPAHTPYQWSNAPSTSTPLDKAHLEAAETDIISYVQATVTGLDSYLEGLLAFGFTPTAVKTASYVAVPSDYVPVNISGGSITLTLPTAPANRSRIGFKIIAVDGSHANTLTVACGGPDVFNKSGGSTSLTFSALFQGAILQYAAGIWYVQSTDSPLGVANGAAQLDATGHVPSSQLSSLVVTDTRTFGTNQRGVLTWSPPALSSPTTITVTTESYHQLRNDTDYIIVMPQSVRGTGLQIDGGRNIWLIGGAANANSGGVAAMLYFTDNGLGGSGSPVAGRIIHIEGQSIAVPANTDGIGLQTPSAIMQIQNCLVTGVAGQGSGYHGDCIQNYSAVQELRVDKFTGTSSYQGITLLPNSGVVGIARLYRTNLRYWATPVDAFTQLLFFYSTGAYTPLELRDFWIANGRAGQSVLNCVYPDNTASAPYTAALDSNKNVTWSGLVNVSGVVQGGIPPTGDFVQPGVVGVGYLSPGYAQ